MSDSRNSATEDCGALDLIPAPCAFLDAEGVILATNRAWRAQDESRGLHLETGAAFVENLAVATATTRAAEGLREVLAGTRESFFYDVASIGARGSRWFRLISGPRAGSGAFVELVDISDRLAEEATLRKREHELRQLIDLIPEEALCALDPAGRITAWNNGASRLLGYSTAEAIGCSLDVLLTDDDPGLAEVILDSARTRGIADREGWFLARGGKRFWGRIRVASMLDGKDVVSGFSMLLQDRTRGDGGASTESTRRLHGIIESATDAIISIDGSQKIVMFNPAAERIFGVRAAEAMGGTLDRFLPERFRAAHSGHIRKFGTTGVTTRAMGMLGTLRGLRADGREFPIEASISQADVGGQRLYTVILRDVSERQKLEEQLLQSQKMEGIGRLAGGVAHDFNNLLTAIFGYVGSALMMLDVSHPAYSALTHTQEAAERAASLTRQLLAFARKQVVNLQVVRPKVVVEGIEPMLRRLIGDDVALRIAVKDDTGSVRADRGQLEQVIINLAVNARDAMPRGGTLTIETMNVDLDAVYCSARVGAEPGPHVTVAVTDTGVGMSPEVLSRLFEPFFTTKGPGKGTGLGLATCHGIVRQSGGHIAVYSEPGRGTSIKVFLPRVGDEGTRITVKTALPAIGGHETILLVEDNEMVRGFVTESLARVGYNIITAQNGPEALRSVGPAHRIDLLITDVVMPEMSGVQLATKLQSERPGMPVLFMSGYTEDTIVHHGVETEGTSFIPKPFTLDALMRKVRSILHHGTGSATT